MGTLGTWLTERKAKKLFPREKKNFWYCYGIYNYSYELHKAGKPHHTADMELPCEKFVINPFRNSGGKIPEEGDIIACIKLDGWIGHYLVTRKWMYSSAGSDFAMWDDGHYIDLKLHHIEQVVS